jgi:hypothetical protein
MLGGMMFRIAYALLAVGVLGQAQGTFTTTGGMTTVRSSHTATLLADGTVLIAGGGNGPNDLSSAELYDPQTGMFTPTGEMTTRRYGHSATLLPDGRVLIVGGIPTPVDRSMPTAELYDPAAKSFTQTGSMAVGRAFHFAILLTTGKVLIAGGVSSGQPIDSSAELYDPSTGTFTRTGDMAARAPGTATLLASGDVLITSDKRAQLYDPFDGDVLSHRKPIGARCLYEHSSAEWQRLGRWRC